MSTSETPQRDPNEAREVSILKRNLRLLKRMVLGKQKPPMLLRVFSWSFLAWDLLMIIGFVFIALTGSIAGLFDGNKGLGALSPKDFYVYALLHAISLLGVILMYRRKVFGFYIFSVANIGMAFWFFSNGSATTTNGDAAISWWWVLTFSLVAILLFALNWNKFTANIKKKEQKKALKASQNQ